MGKVGSQPLQAPRQPPLTLEPEGVVVARKNVARPEIAAKLAEHMANDPLSGREVEVLRNVAARNRTRGIPSDCSPRRRRSMCTSSTS